MQDNIISYRSIHIARDLEIYLTVTTVTETTVSNSATVETIGDCLTFWNQYLCRVCPRRVGSTCGRFPSPGNTFGQLSQAHNVLH